MATYKALTKIKHGGTKGEENVVLEFDPGDVVTGIDKESMKSLWQAGALERVDDKTDEEKKADEEKKTETPTE